MQSKTVIKLLISIIIIIAILFSYFVLIKPAINKAVLNNQLIGYNIAINQTLSQLQQYGYVQINIGNQTLILVPYTPQNSTTQ